jgi:ATP-binding cassette subfamily B protein
MFTVAVILLFAQANLDLALPDYLSQIVNVGIQQSGIESAVPDALRVTTMDRLTLFMSAQDERMVRGAYRRINPGSAAAASYLETYPILASEAIHVLNEMDDAEREQLTAPIVAALLAVSGIEQALADPDTAALREGPSAFDLSQLPSGTDPFQLLGDLPASQRDSMTSTMNAQFSALGEGFVDQMAIVAVTAEYEAMQVDIGRLQNAYMIRVGFWMLGITLLSAVATISVGYLSAKIAAGTGRDLRGDVFRKVESFSNFEFDKFPTASLITRNTNDVTQLQMVTMIMVRLVFYAPIMGVGGIIRAVNKGSDMWWTIAVAVIVLLSVIASLMVIALPKFRMIQKQVDRLNLVARENLSGVLVIRAFNMQAFEEERFEKANLDLTATTLFITRAMVFMMPMMMLIMNVMTVVILWVGAHQVADANMQVGDMMAFMQYAIQIVFSFLMLSFLFIILPRASVSADRIADVLETNPVIHDPPDPVRLNGQFKGDIQFRNVSFRYPGADEDALHEVNFEAKRGELTAFIGSTGSGKSTLVNLIPRFYDVTEGAVLIDGIDVRHVTQQDLRAKIGYIPQKATLFSGSIESNLRYADEDATEEQLLEAIDISQARHFLDGREGGLASEISQKGANVSGGQKQRLSIARALVGKPPIYIFDDTFSALDFKTDAALRRALNDTILDSAVLVVTQRVSTVRKAAQIIVLDQGRVVGKGTHEELMVDCETYREIATSQLTLEELL